MFEQYKKTLWGVQAVILTVTVWVFFVSDHRLSAAAVFYVVMQIGGVLGAAWAYRLKSRLEGRSL
jgi:hypothetical protein